MKTKQEILKMTKIELNNYKWSDDLNKKEINTYCTDCTYCADCTNCTNCTYCTDCADCADCTNCRNAVGLKYAICNVEMTKEEYEAKLLELNSK